MDENTPKPKPYRIHKAKYTTQDVRNKAIEARDEILANIEFMMECIREDRYALKNYKELHGDLRYRPILSLENPIEGTPTKYGGPTELVLEPLASKYRASIKSLFDSVNLINNSILPEDNPEGETSQSSSESKEEATSKRESLRDQFKTMSRAKTAYSPEEPESNEDDFTASVEQGLADAKAGRTKTTLEAKSTTSTKPQDKPWRQTTPKAQAKLIPKTVYKPDVEAEPKEDTPVKKPTMSRSTLESLKTKLPIRTNNLDEIRSRMGISKKSENEDND